MSEPWDSTGFRFLYSDAVPPAMQTAAGINRLLAQRDEARQREDAAVSNQHMLALESQTFEYERDAARAERDDWRATAEAGENMGLLAALREEVADAIRGRDAARAVLAPLLTSPRFGDGDWCVFCRSAGHADHGPDCPVRRKDELLGHPDA